MQMLAQKERRRSLKLRFCADLLYNLQVSPTGASAVSKAGRNAVVTSLMVCCGFVVCWMPNQILFFLNFVGYPVDFGGWFYHFTSYQITLLQFCIATQ